MYLQGKKKCTENTGRWEEVETKAKEMPIMSGSKNTSHGRPLESSKVSENDVNGFLATLNMKWRFLGKQLPILCLVN